MIAAGSRAETGAAMLEHTYNIAAIPVRTSRFPLARYFNIRQFVREDYSLSDYHVAAWDGWLAITKWYLLFVEDGICRSVLLDWCADA